MVAQRTSERKGFLFVLEGIDGAGKSCVCDLISQQLLDAKYPVVRLREPTKESKWGKEIRERSPKGELTPEEELELFLRDREWHISNRINPALQDGKIILLDRYFFASGAYQSVCTGLPWKEILKRNREEIHAPEPDIVFLLDLPVEEGLQRTMGRKESANLQFETTQRLIGVRQAYLEMANNDIGNIQIIDAMKPLDEVVKQVMEIILEYLRKRMQK
jgi:dTMP kinase